MFQSEQERFKLLVEASPMPTAIYKGPEMIISVANQAMLDLWGKDKSVVGEKLRNALPELDGQPFHELLHQVYITGKTYQSKDDIAKLVVDGKLQSFYFTFTYKALKDEAGDVIGIINTAADVTELVLARKQIEEIRERLSFALYSAEIGTWDLDPVNNKVKWDAKCRELFGFTKEGEVLYEDVLSCIHPADEEKVHKAVMAAINPNEKNNYNIRYRTISQHEKKIRWVHCKGKAYFNENDEVYRFAGTAQDISEEVQTRRSEQQLLGLVNNNSDHMSIADMEGNVIYFNHAAKMMLGVDNETDVTALNAKDFYLPDELERVQKHIIKEIDEEKGWQGVINILNKKTQQVIPCQVNYMLIKDVETGEIIGRGATARDLRPELKAKAELQRLAKIVDISEDFCNYCDLNGNTIYLNEAGINLIGMDPGKITSSNMFDYHSEISSWLIKQEIMPELITKGKWSGTLELIHQKTGEIIPIHKQLFIIRQEITDEPVGFAGIARDLRPELNSRKALSDKNLALNKANKELEFLANTVPSIVWTSKPDGNFDYFNQRWFDFTNRSVEESLGARWTEIIHPEDKQRVTENWKYSLETGNPYEVEFRCLDKYGEYQWFLVRALALTDEEGNVIKWYGTNTNVQEQKELERQKDNFLGVASHELKTPVTSIKAYAQVMETMFKRSGDQKNAEIVRKMDKQVNRLNILIGDLLDVTKINTGRLQFTLAEFDFDQMVEEVIEDIQHASNRHLIKKNLNFKRTVYGDRERICQVVTNLLTNAIKYSPEANEIIIYTEDHGHEAKFCVQDFGIGISHDKQDRVFEQFYRVSGTKEHTFPGLGLGLYISSEIVKRLGGRIWVNSVKGKGSLFCFAIPVN